MRNIVILAIALLGSLTLSAQNSLPMPGGNGGSAGDSFPSPGGMAPGAMMGYGPGWGSPWGPPPPPSNPSWSPMYCGSGWENSGTITVMACGYDAQGVWRVLPLRVNYDYNGIQYDVEVINAWNPWSETWNYGVDVEAVNTSYYLRGNTYNYYVVLSTGTYYFNL